MIKNYFKIACRNFLNLKSFGLINLVGLTAGTICSLAILLFVQNQFGYEEQFTDYEHIYKVSTDNLNGNTGISEANLITAGPPIGPTIAKDYEEVTVQVRIVNFGGEYLMQAEGSDRSFFQSGGYLVDSTFFDVFDFPLIKGNYLTALARPNSLILSEKVATKIFDSPADAIGKQVQLSGENENVPMIVTAVYGDIGKSHLKPDFLMSMGSTGMGNYTLASGDWSGNNFVHTYVKLNPNADVTQLKAKLPAMLETYGAEQLKAANKKKTLDLVPITDVHLKTTEYEFSLSKNSDIKFVYMLLAIAFFIQLMACVNYINLTTAQATRRAKEIGVRKVNGAASNSLMMQFIVESVLFSVLAVLLAIPIILLLLPYINQLFNSAFVVSDVFTSSMLVSMVVLGLITGFFSGAYPAFYLAMIDPLKVMKKAFKSGNNTFSLRNGLVVFQFAMVFLLIYAVAVISQQLNHLSNLDKGFSEDQKLVVPLKTTASQKSYSTLKSQLEKMAFVNAVTASEFIPSENIWYDQKVFKSGTVIEDGIGLQCNLARENFFETMGIKLLAGRSVSPTDSTQIVVNETFLRRLNIKQEEALGMIINRQPFGDGVEPSPFIIVGVIQDYNYLSLKDEVQPVATFYNDDLNNMIISYKAANPTKFLKEVEAEWAVVNPGVPFEFKFLDNEMAEVYADEQRLKKVSYTFTTLAIIISLLGIWGLVSFSLERRTKEIGVRKVLGASVGELTQLLSKEFVLLVAVAVLIGTPLAVYSMNAWLDGFAYRIDNTILLLVLAGVLTFGVSLITVIYKTINAAQANPIDSIKME